MAQILARTGGASKRAIERWLSSIGSHGWAAMEGGAVWQLLADRVTCHGYWGTPLSLFSFWNRTLIVSVKGQCHRAPLAGLLSRPCTPRGSTGRLPYLSLCCLLAQSLLLALLSLLVRPCTTQSSTRSVDTAAASLAPLHPPLRARCVAGIFSLLPRASSFLAPFPCCLSL